MDEAEASVQSPHKAVMLPEILSEILSFLDGKSQLRARLVCKQWREVVLDIVHQKVTLTLRVGGHGHADNATGNASKEDVRPFLDLDEIDPRFLSRLKVEESDPFKLRNLLFRAFYGTAMCRIRGVKGGRGIRSLTLTSLNIKSLECFIKMANKGYFSTLNQLSFNVHFRETDGEYKPVSSVEAHAFPNLEKLSFHASFPANYHHAWSVFEKYDAADLPTTLKSFIYASKTIVVLELDVLSDYDENTRDWRLREEAEWMEELRSSGLLRLREVKITVNPAAVHFRRGPPAAPPVLANNFDLGEFNRTLELQWRLLIAVLVIICINLLVLISFFIYMYWKS